MRWQRQSSDAMQRGAASGAPGSRAAAKTDSRGVALVVTLLLLFLMSILGLAAVLSTSSDLLINGYYANYRGSFYAADSGMNIARQTIENSLNPGTLTWNSGWTSCTAGTTNGPLSSATATAAQTAVSTAYASSYSLAGSAATTSGGAESSVPESFKIQNPSVTLATGSPTPNCSTGPVTAFQYIFNYSLTSVGMAAGSEQATVTENGSVVVNIAYTAGGTSTVSFSAFGAFINNFPPCGSPLVYGTLSGPMYANYSASATSPAGSACPSGSYTTVTGTQYCGSWNLGAGGSYTFTDPVNQTGATLSYIDSSGNCTESANTSYRSRSGTTIAPNFESGVNLGQAPVPLPSNSFSQMWAVMDGMGCGEGTSVCGNPTSSPPQPTNANLNGILKDASGNPYPSTGATAGVYIPYTCSGGTCTLNSPSANGQAQAGGIYVEGGGTGSGINTTVTLSTANGTGGSSNPSAQVIQVAQVGTSTTGSPVISQSGSSTCTYTAAHGHTAASTTCTAPFQKQTATTTPTTSTTVTTDPLANSGTGATTVVTQVSTATSTVTATATGSCTVSGSGSCSPSTPSSFSGATTSNSNSTGSATQLNLTGVPENVNANAPDYPGTTMPAATMVYVNGDTNVTGPSSGAAVQNNSMVSLTANGNISQTGNLIYATEPVTTTQNQVIDSTCCNGDPVDTLIPTRQNQNQVLGLYSSNGQFQLTPPSSMCGTGFSCNANMETDASIAMLSSSWSSCSGSTCPGRFSTPGNSVGTWTNVGGRVEDSINGVSINTSNVYFDRRFTTRNNFAPPFFPQTSITQAAIAPSTSAVTTITPQRVQWVSTTGGQ